MPRPHRLNVVAATIGCPVAQLLNDELVLVEVRISDETLERVRREGQPAAAEAGARIARGLESLLLAEATRRPVDVSPGARPNPRRTRAQVLAGVNAAKQMRAARRQR